MVPALTYDPLSSVRTQGGPTFDVFIWGTVFLDIIFAGLPQAPGPGTEVYAEGMASCPGGIANLAVAARRLGLQTSLAAAFSDDDYGDFCWRTLNEQEHIDLTRSRRFPDWHSPVTVSMSVNRDRSMVTHAHPSPLDASTMIGEPPAARAVIIDLAEDVGGPEGWVARASSAGAKVFADVGWDPQERWDTVVLDRLDLVHAFMPNASEAMAYTRTDSPVRALYALADRVPIAVVTNGSDGAMAIDSISGEEAQVPSLAVPELDPTGAGDVFGAAFVMGTLAGWPLAQRLSFSSLAAALALQQFGGSLAAPGWGDIVDWWRCVQRQPSPDSYHRSLLRRYAFLADIVPDVPDTACRRATATIARRADVHGLA